MMDHKGTPSLWALKRAIEMHKKRCVVFKGLKNVGSVYLAAPESFFAKRLKNNGERVGLYFLVSIVIAWEVIIFISTRINSEYNCSSPKKPREEGIMSSHILGHNFLTVHQGFSFIV